MQSVTTRPVGVRTHEVYGVAGMATAGSRRRATESGTLSGLRDALKAAGRQLPSLGLDAASCVGPAPLALIDLGRCNVATARALAAALRPEQGAAR
ncbi:hypothetical protein [Streptomyces qinglanensis]|uniref:hypothetical protein n=1 Tax=Streptomyces qinglanensis TaxID=943816 RepID=UPI003D725753